MNIEKMVERFLNWKLPETVCSDLCVTHLGQADRVGTNMLTAAEAKNMLEHVLDGVEEITWHPINEPPTKTGQYLCRLTHQFIVCSFETSNVTGKPVWNYANVLCWAELPKVPQGFGE